MKKNSPKALTLLLTGIFSILFIVLLYIDSWFNNNAYKIGATFAFILISYLLLYYSLKKFISDRLDPIYKSFLPGKFNDEAADKIININSDIISDIQTEVLKRSGDKNINIEKHKELEKYRRDFLGNVSHELKTPIFNIQGYILTLLEEGINDPKINRLYLERTEKSITRMIHIVEDLEAITKLESGVLELNFEKFDIFSLVSGIFKIEQPFADKKNITLNFQEVYNNPIWVLADKKRISDAIKQLVSNAISYGKNNGNVHVGFYDMDNTVMIEIKDNGTGIEPEAIPRIFERFYRFDKSRSRQQGGTGLGLSIVKHIIEAHNQSIQVQSEPGKGSSFTFTLDKATSKN